MKINVISALVGFSALALGLGACASSSTEDRTTDNTDNLTSDSVETTDACGGGNHKIHCYAKVVTTTTKAGIKAMAKHSAPSGLGATDLQAAYNLDVSGGSGATVAIIDAYGYKNAEADLKVYRAQYGLPACTVASGCLTIVNQEGKTSPLPANPSSDDDWTVETALDLDLASAACPNCKILLIQADDDQGDGLFVSQAIAAQLGATVVSNSWGGAESASNKATDSEHYFQGLGDLGIFVAAGDSGYDNGGQGSDYPSTSAYVTAVGGTNLKKSGSGWTQTAWSGTASTGAGGSSCSLSIPKPAYQANIATKCNFRANSDVAAVGDPATGPAIYNAGQWQQVGGTSAASPFTAAIYALTGHGHEAPGFAYNNTGAFHDVTSGKNGTCGNVLCNAGTGWDGPTGVGTPDGKLLAAIAPGDNTGNTSSSSSSSGSSGSSGSTSSSSSSSSSGGTSSSSSSGSTGSTCSHDACTAGTKLTSGCSDTVTAVCAKDSYCCKTKWDATCVKEVASIANDDSCSN